MKQISLAQSGFELATKRSRKRAFLDEMEQVIPWADLLTLIAPHAPAGKTGRPSFAAGDGVAHSPAAAVLWSFRPGYERGPARRAAVL